MAKKHKKKKQKPLDPRKVAQGRVSVTPLELVRLIHSVNPTKRGYQKKKQAEHYRLKADLQSLLINQFADSLTVLLVENPHLVSLQLKDFDEDGCHALLPELDDSARSWAQMQIDLQTATPDRPDRSQKRKTVNNQSPTTATGFNSENAEYSRAELLRMGKQALVEYDYEQSEHYFRCAFDRSHNDPESALTLLEFYVDTLAAYEQAILLVNSLPAKLKKDSRVCELTALALARSGQMVEALACLGRIVSDRSPEVCLLAGFHFVEQGDAKQAADCYSRMSIPEFSELASEKIRLAEAIDKLRAQRLKPVEDKMLAAWQDEKSEIAAQLAEELLAEDDGNQQARRIRNLFSTRQRQANIQMLLKEANSCHAEEKYQREATLLQQVIELQDKDDPRINKRLQQSLRNKTRQRHQQEIAEVIGLIRYGSLQTGLLQFTALTEEQQQQVIKDCPHNCLNPLSRIMHCKALYKPEKMVEAVMAFDRAGTMLEQDLDPEAVLAVLRPHNKILHVAPEVIELRRKAEQRLHSFKRTQSLTLLQEMRQAIERGQFDKIHDFIDNIDETTLTPEESAKLVDQKNQLHLLEHLQMLKNRYGAEQASNDLFAARLTARELACDVGVGSEEKDKWLEKASQTTDMINREWRLTRLDVQNLPPCYRLNGFSLSIEDNSGVLLDDGRHAVIVTHCGQLLLLYIFDIEEQDKQQVVLLRPPIQMEYRDVAISDNIIWIASYSGALVRISLEPLDIVSYHDFSVFQSEDETVENALLFPNSNYLWLMSRKEDEMEITSVINIQKQIVERIFSLDSFGNKFQRGKEELLADSLFASNIVRIYSNRGRSVAELSLDTAYIINGVVMDTKANEYIFIMHPDIDLDLTMREMNTDTFIQNEEDDSVYLACVSTDGTIIEKQVIQGAGPEMPKFMHRSNKTGLIFVCCHTENNITLQAWQKEDNGLQQLYESTVPTEVLFVHDESSDMLAMVNPLSDEHQLFLLDQKQPECRFENKNYKLVNDIQVNTMFSNCKPLTGELNAIKLAFTAKIQGDNRLNIAEEIKSLKTDNSPDEILAFMYALRQATGQIRLALQLERWFTTHHSEHPYSKVKLAENALQHTNWTECIALLEGLLEQDIYDGLACHICHILGLAHLGIGDPARAQAVWMDGHSYTAGTCELMPLIEYAEQVLTYMENKDTMTQVELPGMLHLCMRIDDALEREDWLSVIETLEAYMLDSIRDIQLLARFVEAFLHLETKQDTGRRLGKMMALAFFCHQYSTEDIFEIGAFLAPLVPKWPDSRLKELAERAEEWLSGNAVECE